MRVKSISIAGLRRGRERKEEKDLFKDLWKINFFKSIRGNPGNPCSKSMAIREIRVLNIRGHHLGVGGQMVEGLQGLAFGLVAVEGGAVGEEEIKGLNDRVVAHGLVEDDVGEGHRSGLALHHHQGLARATEDDGIGALVLSVHLEGVLHRHPTRRHPEVLHKEVQGLLAHLLLGRQGHPTAAQGVEDSHSPVTLFGFEPYQRGCSHYFAKISIIGLPALTDSWFFEKRGVNTRV